MVLLFCRALYLMGALLFLFKILKICCFSKILSIILRSFKKYATYYTTTYYTVTALKTNNICDKKKKIICKKVPFSEKVPNLLDHLSVRLTLF